MSHGLNCFLSIGKLLPYFTETSLTEEEREHQSASLSNLQDPVKGEFSTGEAKDNIHLEVTHTLQKQQEQQSIPEECQEAAPEVYEHESEGKQEMEDQVETFFSSMSHRYEEPLAL